MSQTLRYKMAVKLGPTTIRTVAAMICLTIFAGIALMEGYNGKVIMAYFGLMAALAGVEYAFPRYAPERRKPDEP